MKPEKRERKKVEVFNPHPPESKHGMMSDRSRKVKEKKQDEEKKVKDRDRKRETRQKEKENKASNKEKNPT